MSGKKLPTQSAHPIRPKERFLIFGSPAIEDSEIEEVVDSIRSGWLGTGPKVARFENDFRNYKHAAHAVAVSSCTAALHLSMLAAGLAAGDEVITSPLTFCATVNAIIHAGAVPVLADIDPITMNIDPAQIQAAVTAKTRAILPVHFAGRPCDMDAIRTITQQHELKLIEDCAHAIETEYKGTKAGNFGDFGCFSFYVTKNVITGEGGMVVTRREEDAARIKVLALHGMSNDAWKRFGDEGYKHYYAIECGFKYNMMDLQAAIGIHQLRRVESNWQRRQHIWRRYHEALSDLPITLPPEPEKDTRHAFHLYTIRIDAEKTGITRDEFLDRMNRENIGTGVHYLSIPEHPYYQQTFGWKADDYPHATKVGRQTVSLPLSARLGDEDVADVIQAVHKIIDGRSR
ncbi:MAG: DegT/DnrJ/EryC1/StrS family aminotransferase [Candidatus Latescibacterota bacterium]